jgi:4-hydroxy-3-methylbut-2-enyl diphosphate reductase
MIINIDPNSGFCFGVVYAIQMAEDELDQSGKLFCLGDIVHNNMEVDRLKEKGLVIINHEELQELRDCKVLIRAHGEPPSTYQLAIKNNIELIDASCPVVLKLQNRVHHSFTEALKHDAQIVIYGEHGHAEVNGLVGQTDGKAIVVKTEEDLDKVDFNKPVYFFSQTTKSTAGFENMERLIQERIIRFKGSLEEGDFVSNDTLCRQVSNREPQLKRFAAQHDVIVFVSGKKSSNGKALFAACQSVNPKSYFISSPDELQNEWLEGAAAVGICGATSTPVWLMEKVKVQLAETALSVN